MGPDIAFQTYGGAAAPWPQSSDTDIPAESWGRYSSTPSDRNCSFGRRICHIIISFFYILRVHVPGITICSPSCLDIRSALFHYQDFSRHRNKTSMDTRVSYGSSGTGGRRSSATGARVAPWTRDILLCSPGVQLGPINTLPECSGQWLMEPAAEHISTFTSLILELLQTCHTRGP